MSDCIFCKIASGGLPATERARTEEFVAFDDIDPKAPVHILVIPVRHVASLDAAEDAAALGGLMQFVRRVARDAGVAEAGYRTVLNTGAHGGQAVGHLHAHILGGRQMGWPPG